MTAAPPISGLVYMTRPGLPRQSTEIGSVAKHCVSRVFLKRATYSRRLDSDSSSRLQEQRLPPHPPCPRGFTRTAEN